MQVIIQALVNGILFGTMYGTAAIGLSLIFGTMRIVFIAQGSIIILFSYLCFWLFTLFGIDPYLSIIPVVLFALLLGAGFYHGLFKEAAALQDRISTGNMQGIKLTRGLSPSERDAVWAEVVAQVTDQGCALGYEAGPPPVVDDLTAISVSMLPPRALQPS